MLWIVTAELQTANVAYFQRKIQLSWISAHQDGSPSQLIRISAVLPYITILFLRSFDRYYGRHTNEHRPRHSLSTSSSPMHTKPLATLHERDGMRRDLSHHEFIEHLHDVMNIPGKASWSERRTQRNKQCRPSVSISRWNFKALHQERVTCSVVKLSKSVLLGGLLPRKWDRYVVPKRMLRRNIHPVVSQKS